MKITKPEIVETDAKAIVEKEPVSTEPRLPFVPPKLEKHGNLGGNTLGPSQPGSDNLPPP